MARTCKNHPEAEVGIEQCAHCGGYFCEDCLITQRAQRLCATCKDILTDTSTRFAGRRLASIPVRAVALFLDGMLVSVVFYGALWATGGLNDYFQIAAQQRGLKALVPVLSVNTLAYLIPSIALVITYEAIMLQWRSQTLGKMVMRIKVVGANGQSVTSRDAWVRAGARGGIALVGQLAFIDYLAAFVGREKATLHDRIATTRVVAM